MTADPLAVTAQRALAARLKAVAPILLGASVLPASPALKPDPASEAAEIFDAVVTAIETNLSDDKIWLLLAALSAVYPSRKEIDATRRRFQLDSAVELRMHLLDTALDKVREAGTATAEVDVIIGGVIVDVDHSAKHDLHTGIQRVARNLLPLWHADHDIIPAVWAAATHSLRRLKVSETDRVINWATRGPVTSQIEATPVLLLPWRSVVVLVEVPSGAANDRLAALGSVSGNRLVGIAYDAIPIVSADAVPAVESMKFARYLTAVKFASRMAGISAAATAEIQGFVRMLPTQGLVGPRVSQVSLPSGGHPVRAAAAPGGPERVVLSVGSHEPRKNHIAMLYAAELLWREGLQFTLTFIGGSGWGEEFPRLAADLNAAGRSIDVRKGVSDAELDAAISNALFTVFPSLHEGYGLPVAESMARGTPVITSNFGSMAEIAADGGALMIDPRDDVALTNAMRLLLTSPAQLARLRQEISERPVRGWPEYADELWATLVEPERSTLLGEPSGTIASRSMEGV